MSSSRRQPWSRLFWVCFASFSVAAGAGVLLGYWLGHRNGGSTESVDEGTQAIATPAHFIEATEASGLEFTHDAGDTGQYYFPEIMGAGVALFDFDLDGHLDVYLVNGGSLDNQLSPQTTSSSRSRPDTRNRLFQQVDGRFVDVTERSGLGDPGYGMGVAIGDINNDGYPDVYVTNYGPDRLYLNQRDGTFLDVTEEAGIDNLSWGMSACFFDYDRDGWLDLFVTNYVDSYAEKACMDRLGKRDYCGPETFFPTVDTLYRNESGRLLADRPAGGAPPLRNQQTAGAVDDNAENSQPRVRFADVTLSSGIGLKQGPGLGVSAGDFNSDGWPDLYVANDRTPNFLWINQRDGTFREEAVLFGCAYDSHGRAQAGMGVAVGDVNGDGHFDLFVTNFGEENNALYLSDGRSGFSEASNVAQLFRPSLPYTGWGTALLDINHDGDLDLVVVNGRAKRAHSGIPGAKADWGNGVPRTAASIWQDYAERNQIFLNDGTGRFTEILSLEEESFASIAEVSRGLAVGDIDNDGDLDLIVTNTAGRARLYRNEAEKRGNWLQVRAVEPALGGRDAYGAVITVTVGKQHWKRMVAPGSSYLSSSDPRVHFGLGRHDRLEQIIVRWPDGSSEEFEAGPVNRTYLLEKGRGRIP